LFELDAAYLLKQKVKDDCSQDIFPLYHMGSKVRQTGSICCFLMLSRIYSCPALLENALSGF